MSWYNIAPVTPKEIRCKICHEDRDRDPLISPCLCKGSVAFVHRGCKCAYRGDILGKYANNPEYTDKAGVFDWNRVPMADRPALEV